MVYESDFYTTRRPYRTTPTLSSYTISGVPSRQVRILPGLGKVHIVHTYDRIVPYVGHKRLTVVTTPPKVYSTRPSVLKREYDWIESKVRPWVSYSATNNYLNSDSAVRIVYSRYPYTSSSLYTTSSVVPYGSYSRSSWPYYYDYSWPSYSYYWPNSYRYYWPSYYWPEYKYLRSYLSTYPYYKTLNYYFGDGSEYKYLTSGYSSDYWPYYKYLNTRYYSYTPSISYHSYPSRIVYTRSPVTGIYYNNLLPLSYYNNYYRIYRPLYSYDYWPLRSLSYYDWWPSYSYNYDYLRSYSSLRLQRIFDDETRLIRAQSNALLKRIHDPVPRLRSWPLATYTRYDDYGYPARLGNDNYIHRMLSGSPKSAYVTYYTEPVRKYIGQGFLSCVSYAGDKAYNRRRNVYVYEDPIRSDIQLLSYYVNKFKEERSQQQRERESSVKAENVEEPPSKPEITEITE